MEKFKRIYSEHEFSVLIGGVCLLLMVTAWILLQQAICVTDSIDTPTERTFYRGFVKNAQGYWVVNENGESISDQAYPVVETEDLTEEGNRFVRFQNEEGYYGYLDMVTGEIVIDAVYEEANGMQDNCTTAKCEGQWEILFAWNENTYPLHDYTYAAEPNELGQIPVTDQEGKVGLVNLYGEELIAPRFDWLDTKYRNGLLLFKQDNETGRLLFEEETGVFYNITEMISAENQDESVPDFAADESPVEFRMTKSLVKKTYEEVTDVVAFEV